MSVILYLLAFTVFNDFCMNYKDKKQALTLEAKRLKEAGTGLNQLVPYLEHLTKDTSKLDAVRLEWHVQKLLRE